ncbi:hypothetical protein ACQ4LD_21305, partial [Sphingobacterium daejeonense]
MQYPMFHTLDYLKNGSEIQRKSFNLLKEYMVFEHLSEYNPILIGKIPINRENEEDKQIREKEKEEHSKDDVFCWKKK